MQRFDSGSGRVTTRHVAPMLALLALAGCQSVPDPQPDTAARHLQAVKRTPGLVAFWDFEPEGHGRILSVSDPALRLPGYAMKLRRIGDPRAYDLADWPYGTDGRATIATDASGPFGHALQLDTGHLYAESPREAFDGGPLDLTGRKPFTLIAWVKFTGQRHMIAGIWDEGGWDRYAGRRQAALFAGLFNQKGIIAHISSTGAASFPQSQVDGAQYARRRAIDGQPFENGEWIAAAMTFDPVRSEVVAWLDGKMVHTAIMDPVEQDAYGLTTPPPSNPYHFAARLFGPLTPTLKFNGYDLAHGGIAEHRLLLDLHTGTARYESDGTASAHRRFRIRLEATRAETTLFAAVGREVTNGRQLAVPWPVNGFRPGDRIKAVLEASDGANWAAVGDPVLYVIREGAPFTVGRALGLGSGIEKIDEGSQMAVDGIAVFNRVLSRAELDRLAFGLGKR